MEMGKIAGGLVWIVGSLLAAVAILFCLTVILLPLGIPLFLLARRILALGARLMMPRSLRHPVQEGTASLTNSGARARKQATELTEGATGALKKGRRRLRKQRRTLNKALQR